MTNNTTYDAIIIGAGHNGLTCAGYLARAGLKVKVVEKRHIVGGAAVTEEFFPEFRNSICSYIVSMLDPNVIKDLELEKHGLELIERQPGIFSALPNGRHLIISDNHEENYTEISKFSTKDAKAHKQFIEELNELAPIIRTLLSNPAPNMGGGISEIWQSIKIGKHLYKLPIEVQERLAMLMTTSLGDYLDSWFESDEVKGYYAGDGSIGNLVNPYSSGSAYNLLHHSIGNIKGKSGSWWHAKGGMGSITQAMAKSAMAFNVDIETNAAVKEIIINENSTTKATAQGVILEDGRIIHAKKVIANCTPSILFLKLLKSEYLSVPFERRIKNWRCRSGSLRMNLALSELPDIISLRGTENPHKQMQRSINICPSTHYMESAFRDARVRGFARKPFISMNIPTLIDDTLAPEGHHIASLFCQHFHPNLPDNLDWDQLKDEAVEAILNTVNEIAPNFKESIIGTQVLTPKDLENEFSLTGGDIFHGALHMDQIYSLRPAAGYANYRTPIKDLYICGAGAHPGGGVTGIPGKLAAKEILKDK